MTLSLFQLGEDDLLPTTYATLPASKELQLPRVAACKLSLPQVREGRVTNDYYAIMGSTLLLRQCPLASQPALQLPQGRQFDLPPLSAVKLPRLDMLSPCKQTDAFVAGKATSLYSAPGIPSSSSSSSSSSEFYSSDIDVALVALVSMLYSSGVVPAKDHKYLAYQLYDQGIAGERDLQLALRDNPELLASIGMKSGQQSCLTRHLNRPPAVAGEIVTPPAHPEAAALDTLKRFLVAAGVFPRDAHDTIAWRLIEQGVANEISLRESLAHSPPDFDLKSVMSPAQAYTIIRHLEKMQ